MFKISSILDAWKMLPIFEYRFFKEKKIMFEQCVPSQKTFGLFLVFQCCCWCWRNHFKWLLHAWMHHTTMSNHIWWSINDLSLSDSKMKKKKKKKKSSQEWVVKSGWFGKERERERERSDSSPSQLKFVFNYFFSLNFLSHSNAHPQPN